VRITNRYGLPQAIVNAVTYDGHATRGDFSATELVLPPRIRMLRKRHDDEMVEDASERLWLLQGQAIHATLEHSNVANALQEEGLTWRINGTLIYGTPDWYEEYRVVDYKNTSVWKALAAARGEAPEWDAQVNIYAQMYREIGFRVDELYIAAILRDWQGSRAMQGGDYPPRPFLMIPVSVWSPERVWYYVVKRIGFHRRAERRPDDELPVCTPEERWEKPTVWAVMLKDRKRARRLLASPEEAELYIQCHLNPKARMRATIVERPGLCVRCAGKPRGYCGVNQWCNWYQERRENNEPG